MKWTDHYGSWRGKQGTESLPCFRSDPNDQALKEEGKEAGSQPLLCHYQAPLQSCSSLELKTSHLISKHAQTKPHVISTCCFPLSVSLLCLMEDFWEMKKMSPPPVSVCSFVFGLKKKKKRNTLMKRGKAYTAWAYSINPRLYKEKCLSHYPHLALDMGFQGLRK